MASRWMLVGCACPLFACYDAPTEIPWPSFPASVSTVVVATAQGGGIQLAYVFDDEHRTLPFGVDANDTTHLYALGLRQNSEDLNLTAGELEPARGESVVTLGSHNPAEQWVLSLAEEPIWKPAPPANPLSSMNHRFVPPPDKCGVPQEAVQILNVPKPGGSSTLMILDDDHLLTTTGTAAGKYEAWNIEKSGASTQVPVPATNQRIVLSEPSGRDPNEPKYLYADTQLYLVTWDGSTVHLEEFRRTDANPDIVQLFAHHSRLYAFTRLAEFLELEGDHWKHIYHFPSHDIGTGDLLVREDDTIVVTTGQDAILMTWDGFSDPLEVDPGFDGAARGLGETDELGLLVGDGVGNIWRGPRFEWIGPTEVSLGINDILATDQGFVFVAHSGLIGQYVDGRFCKALQVTQASLFHLRHWGSSIVVRSRALNTEKPLQVMVLPPP